MVFRNNGQTLFFLLGLIAPMTSFATAPQIFDVNQSLKDLDSLVLCADYNYASSPRFIRPILLASSAGSASGHDYPIAEDQCLKIEKRNKCEDVEDCKDVCDNVGTAASTVVGAVSAGVSVAYPPSAGAAAATTAATTALTALGVNSCKKRCVKVGRRCWDDYVCVEYKKSTPQPQPPTGGIDVRIYTTPVR